MTLPPFPSPFSAAVYSTQQLMEMGRKKNRETDARLDRMNRVVEDTIQIGNTTAETLKGQTEQVGCPSPCPSSALSMFSG